MGAMQRAGMHGLAKEAMLPHDVEDQLRAIAQQIEQAVAIRIGQRLEQDLRHHPHAGIDQTDIAAGTAEADLDRFDDRNLHAGLRQMQGGGDAGETAADHRDRDAVIP